MSTKIKCRSVYNGISLPCDVAGMNWVRNVWQWLLVYVDSIDNIGDRRNGKITAMLALLKDMEIITDDLWVVLHDKVVVDDYELLREIAKKQAEITTNLYWTM